MRHTVKSLKRQAKKGLPISRTRVARATAKSVRRVLGSPKAAATAIVRNSKVSRKMGGRSSRRIRSRATNRRRTTV